jgi:hypothetical protein
MYVGLGDVISGVSGLGDVSPLGSQDFNSFQNAVIASFPPCPPPFDPTCQNPRDAAIAAALNAWVTDPGSCHNIVCDATGQPLVSYQPYTTPTGQPAAAVGINSTSGFVPLTPGAPPSARPAPAPASSPAPVPVAAPASPRLPAGTQPVQVGAPPPSYQPVLSFVTSRGGNSLQPGDTWTVTISGAPPNAPVMVTGPSSGAANNSVTSQMGATDANGNFYLSGTITPDQAGVWPEVWSVAGQTVGSFMFTVMVPPAAPAPAPSPAPGSPQGTAPIVSGGPSFFTQPVTVGNFQIPIWGFILAAGGAALFLLGEAKS